MRTKILIKSLLAAAALGVGSNAWGAAALTSSFTVTGYEYAHLIDFQNKTYDGTSFSTMEDLTTTFGVTSQQTIQTSYANGVWYDDTSNGRGLRHNGGGGRWITFPISISKDDYVIINGGLASNGTYGMTMTNGSSATITEAADYLCFKANADATSLTLTVNRYNYLLQILVMTKDASAETGDYTINYKYEGNTIATDEGTEAVGTVVNAVSTKTVDGVKYVLDGGQTTSMTLVAGTNVLDVTVSMAAQYTCTVNAMASSTLLASPSKTVYDGESVTVYYQKGYNLDGTWYLVEPNGAYPSYGRTFSSVKSNTSYDLTAYSANENVVFYGEVENMNLSGKFAADGGQTNRYSNGSAKRLFSDKDDSDDVRNTSYVYTDNIAAGVYTVTMWARNQSSSQTATLPVFLRNSEGELTDISTSFEAWGTAGQGEHSVEITIPDDGTSYSIAIYDNTGYNSNLEMDYVIVTKVTSPITITDAGWATLYTDKAVDFSGTGLTAYTATYADGTVTLNEVSDVPANTGVVLKGEADTYNIPVIASSETAKGDLKGSATDALTYDAEAENDYYMLALNAEDKAQFTKLTSGTIAAGKAYLQIAKNAAPNAISVVFADESTGIAAVGQATVANDRCYNLSGQRVSTPQKGLYIKDGKKYIIK